MTTPTPAQQLEEVLTLLEKATPAPWTMDERDIIERTGAMLGIYIARPNGTRILETFANCGIDDEACEANAALIVSLVNAAPLLRRALAALEAVECDCATKVNQVCDKCCAKTEAVWLMPVATMEPQNGKLLQYAHGRSHLSTGQMAHAYQCIVEAAKECGQIIPADAVEVSRG